MTDVRVLVATDGREQSDGALRAGSLFTGDGQPLHILAVLPVPPAVSPEIRLSMVPERAVERRDELLQAVETQLHRVFPTGRLAEIQFQEGEPAATVARVARESAATMITTGLGRHRIVDRVLGDETALRIVREATVPVFAAGPEVRGVPCRVVIGVDFSDMSSHASQLAARLSAEAATLYLVHVSPHDDVLSAVIGGRKAYEERAHRELDRLRHRLQLRGRQYAQGVIRRGDPASELLRYAADVDADLIATGAHGLGFIARILVGSVATKILRGATSAALVVPEGARNANAA